MSATNKNIAKLLRQEIWNTGNFAIADEICADDAVFHSNDPLTPDFGEGPQALKQLVTMYRAAFPDAHITIEDIVAEGNRVVIRWTGRGTHKGNLGRIAPTGKTVTVTGSTSLASLRERFERCGQIGTRSACCSSSVFNKLLRLGHDLNLTTATTRDSRLLMLKQEWCK
jgi:predicted ester cyclase